MKFLYGMVLLLLVGSTTLKAQTEYIKWHPLIIDQQQRIWYDASTIDTLSNNKYDVWVLQMHQPPLTFEGIQEKVYRSRTQYGIDLNTGKYGILKVIYYGVTNNILYNFDYHIDNYPDNLKYTYPVADNSYMKLLVEDLSKGHNK